jgi:hypothetical protein
LTEASRYGDTGVTSAGTAVGGATGGLLTTGPAKRGSTGTCCALGSDPSSDTLVSSCGGGSVKTSGLPYDVTLSPAGFTATLDNRNGDRETVVAGQACVAGSAVACGTATELDCQPPPTGVAPNVTGAPNNCDACELVELLGTNSGCVSGLVATVEFAMLT